jgi:hypothetical protein
MLIVQRIQTEWTKKSRGGEPATFRNTVPEALPLPSLVDEGADGIVHDVRHRECDDFRPQAAVRPAGFDRTCQLGSLWLYRQVDRLAVRFVWSWHETGAPERKSHDAFVLEPGQWGRLKCNGRFSDHDSGAWWYRQDTFNVAWIQDFDPNRFLNTMPDFEVVELARLR